MTRLETFGVFMPMIRGAIGWSSPNPLVWSQTDPLPDFSTSKTACSGLISRLLPIAMQEDGTLCNLCRVEEFTPRLRRFNGIAAL